jgi:glucosamine kinase
MSIHFIGVDAGGSRTRALLATAAGEVIGAGQADGANAWSSGTSIAEVLGTAIRAAIDGTDPALVAAGVVAVAGALDAPEVADEVAESWQSLGLPGSPQVVPDVLAAYAAGTTAPAGVALVAGTGSIAAAVSRGEVRATSGGHGWLLGDEGSAVWLGRQGIQAALRALDGRGPETLLATAIPGAFGIEPSDASPATVGIVAAAHRRPPAQLGRLAPVVLEAAEAGDRVADALVEAAAGHLTELVEALVADQGPPVIVLSGSLLTNAAAVRRLVRARLAERWPGAILAETNSGEAGAVALAISRHTGMPVSDATLDRLRGSRRP